jgi:hypothetical protein
MLETLFRCLTCQRGVPSTACHDVTISWRGVPSGTRLTALSDFSFHLSSTYEAITFALNSLVDRVVGFNVVYISILGNVMYKQ